MYKDERLLQQLDAVWPTGPGPEAWDICEGCGEYASRIYLDKIKKRFGRALCADCLGKLPRKK